MIDYFECLIGKKIISPSTLSVNKEVITLKN